MLVGEGSVSSYAFLKKVRTYAAQLVAYHGVNTYFKLVTCCVTPHVITPGGEGVRLRGDTREA